MSVENRAQALIWPGIILCGVIASISFITGFIYKPVSPLMWAFIYSILIGNIIRLPRIFKPGIDFSARDFLRGVIASLGIVTSALVWIQVGIGVLNSLAIVFLSLILAPIIGGKLGLSRNLSILIGVGTGICGASAIAATGPAINAKEEEMGVALTCITIFGLTAMILYPALFTSTMIGELLHNNLRLFAIWAGSGIHEVAQVAAAAGSLGVAGEALLVKSIRVFMIGPTILIATYMALGKNKTIKRQERSFVLPAYGIVFVLLTFICAILDMNTQYLLSVGFDWLKVKSVLSDVVLKFLLALCFAGVGLKVNFRDISKLGVKSFVVGALISALIGVIALILAIIVAPFVPSQ
ncbi:MAG: putative sulfate exporter family transporter [Desulfurococcaceae archaeon]